MATTHLKDIVAVVGTYQDRDGNEKKQYRNVGRLLRNDNGEFMVVDRTFNPAGMPGADSQVFLSLFNPRPRDDHPRNSEGGGSSGGYGAHGSGDEIPF